MPTKTTDTTKQNDEPKKLYRSKIDRVFAGVCGGVAEYFNIDVLIVRIIWLILFFFNGIGIIIYLVSLFVMQENPEQSAEDKKEQNTAIYWGIGLVLLGISLLSSHWRWDFWSFHPFRWYWFDLWPFDWDTFWPVVIIILGVLYLLHVIRQDKTGKSSADTPLKLFRSKQEKVIGGVCGGIAKNLHIDPVIVRIGWVILSLATKFILGIIVYILWMIIIPEESDEAKTKSVPSKEPKPKAKAAAKPKKPINRVKKLPKENDTDKK